MPSNRTSSTVMGLSGTIFGGVFEQPTARETKKAGPAIRTRPRFTMVFLPTTNH